MRTPCIPPRHPARAASPINKREAREGFFEDRRNRSHPLLRRGQVAGAGGAAIEARVRGFADAPGPPGRRCGPTAPTSPIRTVRRGTGRFRKDKATAGGHRQVRRRSAPPAPPATLATSSSRVARPTRFSAPRRRRAVHVADRHPPRCRRRLSAAPSPRRRRTHPSRSPPQPSRAASTRSDRDTRIGTASSRSPSSRRAHLGRRRSDLDHAHDDGVSRPLEVRRGLDDVSDFAQAAVARLTWPIRKVVMPRPLARNRGSVTTSRTWLSAPRRDLNFGSESSPSRPRARARFSVSTFSRVPLQRSLPTRSGWHRSAQPLAAHLHLQRSFLAGA